MAAVYTLSSLKAHLIVNSTSNTHGPDPMSVQAWWLFGKCRDLCQDAFFFEGLRGHAYAEREAAAKEICKDCPVLVACRTHALEQPELYGIWGATSPKEREVLRRRRHDWRGR